MKWCKQSISISGCEATKHEKPGKPFDGWMNYFDFRLPLKRCCRAPHIPMATVAAPSQQFNAPDQTKNALPPSLSLQDSTAATILAADNAGPLTRISHVKKDDCTSTVNRFEHI